VNKESLQKSFKEQEHKRDEHGKFTNKGSVVAEKKETIKKKKAPAKNTSEAKKKAPTKKAPTKKAPRAERTGSYKVHGTEINSPEDLVTMFADLADEDREKLYVVAMKGNKPIATQCVHIGAINSSIVHPKDVIKTPVLSGADGFYILHNHPSGRSSPSPADVDVTKRLNDTGTALGVEFKGHAVIGDDYTFISNTGEISGFGGVDRSKSDNKNYEIPQYETYQDKDRSKKVTTIRSPDDFKSYISNNLKLDDGANSVYMLGLDTKNQIGCAVPIDMTQDNKEIRKQVMHHIVNSNALSVAFAVGNQEARDALFNVGIKREASGALGADVLDVLVSDPEMDGYITSVKARGTFGLMKAVKVTKRIEEDIEKSLNDVRDMIQGWKGEW
jgi:DNA repair protein RadC